MSNVLEFPSNFHFGTSVAAYQVEGNDGNRKSDWDTFIKSHPSIIKPHEKGPQWWIKGKAEKDLEMIAGLGMKIQRLSLEWARIEPEKGEINHEAILRYKEIIQKVFDLGMSPLVTINHYVLPDWIARQGSWENDKTVGYYNHFVKFIVNLFPEVTHWITINEPNVLVASAYLSHYFPPQRNSVIAAFRAGKNLLHAHRKAYTSIKNIAPLAKVGISFSFRWNRAKDRKDIFERGYANLVNNISEISYVKGIQDKIDFIGCNYYTGYFLNLNIFKYRMTKRHDASTIPQTILFGESITPHAYLSDYGWPIVPNFFLDLLRKLHKACNKPIIITENGIADADDKYRSFYILVHLVALWRALQEGIPVHHYIHWSTVDNLEWIEGYGKRFGLIAIDQVTGERKLRRSAHLYKEIATTGRMDIEKLIEKHLEGRQQNLARRSIANLLQGKVRMTSPEDRDVI